MSYRYDPVGRLLSATSRLGVETFAFDPASNLLREYAGTHYEYDERGNQIRRNRSMNTTFKVLSLSPMLCSRFSQEPAPP